MSTSRGNRSKISGNKQQDKFVEDEQTDSGFLSAPLSSEILSGEMSYHEDASSTKKDNTHSSSSASDNNKSEKMHEIEEDNMDSGIIESGIANLSIEQADNSGNNNTSNKLPAVDFAPNEDGDTYLHLSIIWDQQALSKVLITMVPEPEYLNLRNNVFLAPLHLAVLFSQPAIVRDLVLAGAKPTVPDRHFNTALHLACSNNEKECVRQLLKPLNASEASRRKPGTYRFPQDLELWNTEGETCIHVAAKKKTTDIIKILVEHGADINAREGKQGRTILHKACEEGDEQFVAFLLSNFADKLDLEETTYAGETAYQIAVAGGHQQRYRKIAQELRSCGADPLDPVQDADSDEEMSTAMFKSFDTNCPLNVA